MDENEIQKMRAAADQVAAMSKELVPVLRAFFLACESEKFDSKQALYLTGRYLAVLLGKDGG